MAKELPANHPETIEAMRAICKEAGIPDSETSLHPEYGLLVSPAAVQRLRALAPPSLESARIGQWAANVARSKIRGVW